MRDLKRSEEKSIFYFHSFQGPFPYIPPPAFFRSSKRSQNRHPLAGEMKYLYIPGNPISQYEYDVKIQITKLE